MYGTLHSELDRLRGLGSDVVLELDVQGMRSVRKLRPEAVTIFIKPPSLEILDIRLRKRGDLSEAGLRLRLQNAKAEMAAEMEYDYQILNDDLDRAVAEFESVLRRARETAP
jgi:guanylate kinase